MITGSIITRTQGDDSGRAREGHALVTIVGIIEVPNDSELNSEGVQFAISQDFTPIQLTDHKDRFRGYSLGSLITEPIWRT